MSETSALSTLFKVLDRDGEPAHGGTGAYVLPNGKPGDWLPAIKDPVACERGYHLTSRPASWWGPGYRLFLAEWKGAVDFKPPDKMACESIRLLEEVTHEWPLLPLYPEIRALLVSSWRARNLDAKTLPDWANLSRADLRGADLRGANLSRADLRGADLRGADLSGAYLSGAYLSGAYLSGAYLYGANLYGTDLSGANLSGAYLYGANLYGTDLSGANLYGANLRGADLRGADLSGAYLSRANLSRANLSRANLYGTDLRGADLSGAINPIIPAGWELRKDGLVVKAG